MHEVLVNRLGGLSLPRKSVVRLTGRPDMALYVYRGRKTTIQTIQSKLQNPRTGEGKKIRVRLFFMYMPHLKFQDSSISGSRVSQLPSITDIQTDGQTDGQAQTNMPPQLLRSCGHKYRKFSQHKAGETINYSYVEH